MLPKRALDVPLALTWLLAVVVVAVAKVGAVQLAEQPSNVSSSELSTRQTTIKPITLTSTRRTPPTTTTISASTTSAVPTSTLDKQSRPTRRTDRARNNAAKYKLPTWFNYKLYKQLYNKRYASRRDNELHKRIYLRTALTVFEQRAKYRAGRLDSLASMNELSDLVSN